MKSFNEMLRRVTTSPHHKRMQSFAVPLADFLGVNHFWYYKITNSGHYSYVGTHIQWSEYCFDAGLTSLFPCLRHPRLMPSGLTLMKASDDPAYNRLLNAAWEKFNVNFNINLVEHTKEGIEAFGFGTRFKDPQADQRLLNELPLLRYFIKSFRQNHPKLFQLLEDNQIDLTSEFGAVLYERPKAIVPQMEKHKVLNKMGLSQVLLLSSREKEVLKFLANGYPASFIATKLKLKTKTIENYIITIKDKLSCYSKVDLISKANEVTSLGILD